MPDIPTGGRVPKVPKPGEAVNEMAVAVGDSFTLFWFPRRCILSREVP